MTTRDDLTADDHCDRCGARAYVRVKVFVPAKGEGELLFCAHDYQQHEAKLVLSGARVLHDQRRLLQTHETLV